MSAVPATRHGLDLGPCPPTLEDHAGAWTLLSTILETCPSRPDVILWVGRQWSIRRLLILREGLAKTVPDNEALAELVAVLKRSLADADLQPCWTTLHSEFSYYADLEEASDFERLSARICMGEVLTWGFGAPHGLSGAVENAALAAGARSGSSIEAHLSMEAIGLSTLISEAQGYSVRSFLGGDSRRGGV